MFDRNNNTNGAKNTKQPRKKPFRKLFHTAWETREDRVPDKLKLPNGKVVDYVPKYTQSIAGSWNAYKGEFKKFLIASLYFALFVVPLMVLLFYGLPKMKADTISQSYSFMGNIGIGYPGAIDNLGLALANTYDIYQITLIYAYCCVVFMAIGMAGFMNVAKKILFCEKFKFTTKPFVKGIFKYGIKYVLIVAFGGGVGLAMGTSILYHLKAAALGIENAGTYCACIFTCIFGAFLMLYCLVLLTIIPSYKMNIFKMLQTAFVLMVYKFPMYFIVGLLSIAPVGIMATKSLTIEGVFMAVMLGFGFALIFAIWTGVGQGSYTKVAAKMQLSDEQNVLKERNINNKKKRKDLEKEYAKLREIRGDKPVVQKSKQQQGFQNPKKKKKK